MTITVGKLLLIIAALIATVALCIAIVLMNHQGSGASQANTLPSIQINALPSVQTNAQATAASLPQITSSQANQLAFGDDKPTVEAKLGAIGVTYNSSMGSFSIPGTAGRSFTLGNENDCWMYAPQPMPSDPDVIAVCFSGEGKLNSFKGSYGFGGPAWPPQG